jgi:Kef-type K+ transport system membrane component KefB
VCGVAILGKFGGCGVAAWLGGLSRRESACVGCMMNTRGLMELIVANLGKELGVIPDSVFCMLVLMALVTTFMTTPLLLRLARGTELEGPIRQAGWLGGSPEKTAGEPG